MLTTASISLFLFAGLANLAESAPQDGTVCKTESCLDSANNLKLSMDTSVDPCDNFYKYACGNFPKWKADKHHPEDPYSWPVEMNNNITDLVREFMYAKLKKSDPKAVLKAQHLFQSCLDADSMNKKGLDGLRQLLKDTGVSDNSPPFIHPTSNFSWTYSAAKVKRLINKDFLIKVEVVQHSGIYRIEVGLSYDDGIEIPKTLQKSLKDVDLSNASSSEAQSLPKGFFEYNRALIKGMSDSKTTTDETEKIIQNGIAGLAAFAVRRKQIADEAEDSEAFPSPAMTLEELQNRTNSFVTKGEGKAVLNWEEYLKTLFDGIEGMNIDFTKEKLYVLDEDFFQKLVELLMETSSSTLESAIWFNVVSELAGFTTDEMRELKYGNSSTATKWEEYCYSVTEKLAGLAIAHHFVDDEVIVQQKYKVINLLKHMKIALGVIIEKADWMDNTTKATAIEKIKQIKDKISHPSWLLNDTFLNEYYENLTVFKNDFMKTMLKWQQCVTIKDLEKVGKKWDWNDARKIPRLQFDPFMINAFYQPSENTIIIPMGILRKPFYQNEVEALNFGALGYILGHEVTHGFDDTGRQYDSQGNEENWWQKESLSNYKNRTQCFIDSYNSITVGTENKLSCNGQSTLDENIADNGGFRESLMAYKYFLKENNGEPKLYGFENFTHEQLYTLAFANTWCEASTDKSLLFDTKVDDHGPKEARIRGVLMNSEEFVDIWKCPKGSNMNPDKPKCRIW